jgi:hypothetical protein
VGNDIKRDGILSLLIVARGSASASYTRPPCLWTSYIQPVERWRRDKSGMCNVRTRCQEQMNASVSARDKGDNKAEETIIVAPKSALLPS